TLGIIDAIIPEPVGGAHRDPEAVIMATGNVVAEALRDLSAKPGDQLRRDRRQRYLNIGRQL
ncbi:MAG TPA: acetyl-CoA carboxylase carboxyl transferase subunit alpha, partial [Mycoplana sp.]|nr:acetyl-CoA carboxylase carboxyl transferase subunit alpha [Mycoplana sp.]